MRRGMGVSGRHEAAESILIHALRDALQSGDDRRLAVLLGPGVRVVVDSGGLLEGTNELASGPVHGLGLLLRALGPPEDFDLEPHSVNGRTALVCREEGRVVGIVSVDGRVGRVTDVWIVRNPEKLAHWNRQT